MEDIHIVTATDDKYAKALCVMLTSLLENKRSNRFIHLYIIDGGISPLYKNKFKTIQERYNINLIYLSIDRTQFSGFNTSGHVDEATYYRILIPELLSQSIDKALYLDSDLIIRDDITFIWNIDIDLYAVGAVEDPHCKAYRLSELEIPEKYSYFNAGILLMNLKKWRKENISTQVLEYIRNNESKIKLWDQDALNAILYDQWFMMDEKWNVQVSFAVANEAKYILALKAPAIIHYTGPVKPWDSKKDFIEWINIKELPYRDEYYVYLIKWLGLEDGLLIKGSSKKVYIMKMGRKHPIVSRQEFESSGYQWEDIIYLPEDFVNQIPEG